jgi:hypothetical protein
VQCAVVLFCECQGCAVICVLCLCFLQGIPHTNDPDVQYIAQIARSAAALQPDNSRVPIDRCESCLAALEVKSLYTGPGVS